MKLGIEHMEVGHRDPSPVGWEGGCLPIDADAGERVEGIVRCDVFTELDNVVTMQITCHVYTCSETAKRIKASRK